MGCNALYIREILPFPYFLRERCRGMGLKEPGEKALG
jgi:hypothetical protein